MKDTIVPFLIDKSEVRGRVVRLHDSVDKILSQHAYPEMVSRLLAEVLTMAAMLAAQIKWDGIFTIQARGDGPVSLVVADASAGGNLRGYAQFDESAEEQFASLARKLDSPKLTELMGKGYLAVMLERPGSDQPYQGVVELSDQSLSEAIEAYYEHSQQLPTFCRVVSGQVMEAGKQKWVSGGLMLERLPHAGSDIVAEEREEAWVHARLLARTIKDHELLDTSLPLSDLLYRLFHEQGVWVYDGLPLQAQCRCSREKVAYVLKSMPRESVEEMKQDGVITSTCQFCSSTEKFSSEDVEQLFAS